MATESFDGYGWIKVPRYVMDETKSWEERYRELEQHHIQETTFLIGKVRELAAVIAQRANAELKMSSPE
jgi:hypothetical protein